MIYCEIIIGLITFNINNSRWIHAELVKLKFHQEIETISITTSIYVCMHKYVGFAAIFSPKEFYHIFLEMTFLIDVSFSSGMTVKLRINAFAYMLNNKFKIFISQTMSFSSVFMITKLSFKGINKTCNISQSVSLSIFLILISLCSAKTKKLTSWYLTMTNKNNIWCFSSFLSKKRSDISAKQRFYIPNVSFNTI